MQQERGLSGRIHPFHREDASATAFILPDADALGLTALLVTDQIFLPNE